VGDFLQKVYATVAILRARLPAKAEVEQGVLARLRHRAEGCRNIIDAAHDFICPLTLEYDTVDLTALAEQLAEAARQRFPNVTILTESNGSACVPADPHRAAWVGEALLNNACVAARSEVRFRKERDDGHREVVWSIRDDGPGVSKETASQ